MGMTMQPVKSSNVKDVGHDADTNTLGVQFHSGATYHYHDVPAEKHAALLASESIGKFIGTDIKPHHKFALQV